LFLFSLSSSAACSDDQEGIKKVLSLIWSKDEPVRDAVVGAYLRLFLSPPPEVTSAPAKLLYIAKNLVR
jgi:hypothetical protein